MSFLAPLGLLLGLLAAPLAALYFLKIRRRRVKVPSTLLWQAFARSERMASPFEKFKRNLLLLLQLLILLAIVLAFARPCTEAEVARARSVVLVVDATASMGATDVGSSRLDVARDRARDVLDGMGVTDEVMLVVVGSSAEVVVPFTRDEHLVEEALADLSPTQAQGSLHQGLQLALSLARSRADAEVVVLSDGSNEPLGQLSTGGALVRYEPIGRSARNAGIAALDLRASPSSDLQRQLFVTVKNYGLEEVEGTVEVYLEGQLVGLRTEPMPPDEPVAMVFELAGGARGLMRVRLQSDGDVLPADDQAWVVVSAAARRRVLLVDGDKLTARALAADPRVELMTLSSAELSPELIAKVDATVFAGPVPPDMDGHDYAVLGPHPGSPVRFGPEQSGVGVLGWGRTHPVNRFVEWDPVVIARARAVEDSGGLVAVVNGMDGPLVLAGERSGGRVVQLAFDPLDSDLPLRVGWPVLLLNTVGWLTEGSDGASEAHLVATGSPYTRRVPRSVTQAQVSGPEDAAVVASVSDGLLKVRGTDRVGVYDVSAGPVQARFAANLLSERESTVAPRRELRLAEGVAELSHASMVGRRELWRPLLWLALAILLVEWGVYHWRRVG